MSGPGPGGHEPAQDEPPDEELPQHRRVHRTFVLIATLAAVVFGVVMIVVKTQRDAPQANLPPVPSINPTPTLSIPPNPTAAPEQDAITALNKCGGDCTTYVLSSTMLRRTGLRGLLPTLGVRVTDGRAEQTRSIIGRVGATQVRLLYERVALPDAALRVTDSKGPGRTVVLAVIRSHWRLTAVLVGAQPPIAAATTWARSAPLPR